jgi:hypothetical protein
MGVETIKAVYGRWFEAETAEELQQKMKAWAALSEPIRTYARCHLMYAVVCEVAATRELAAEVIAALGELVVDPPDGLDASVLDAPEPGMIQRSS